VCQWMGAVGPWPLIDPAWLNTKIERRTRSPLLKWGQSLGYAMHKKLGTAIAHEDWQRVKQYVTNPQRLAEEAVRLRSEL
jgi:hypothetical protein